jgi:predicted outer membrane protein
VPHWIPTAATGALMLALLAGCKREQSSNYPTMGADTMAGTQAVAGGDTGRTSNSQPGQLSDANIVALLDEANMADSAAGAYALTKATKADVKAFAKLMMGEHHALRAQGQRLAQQLQVTPEMPTNDPVKPLAMSEMTLLTSSSKQEFDSVYIAQEVDVHKAVLDLAGKAHDAAQSAELKKLIEQARPVIEKHLASAQAIQKKLSKPVA